MVRGVARGGGVPPRQGIQRTLVVMGTGDARKC